MRRALDLSKDFTTVVDFQESVTFFSRTADGTVAAGIPIAHCTRRNPEDGTTGEGRTTQLRRVRFFGSEDLSINLTTFLLPQSELQGNVPKRTDVIKDQGGDEFIIKYVEINQTQIGTYRCATNKVPRKAS